MADVLVTVDPTDLLSVGATFTLIEHAGELLKDVEWADEEIAVIQQLPLEVRLQLSTRLTEVADMIREHLYELDGRILQLRI